MYNVGEYLYDANSTNLYIILETIESIEQIKYYDYILQNVETKEIQQVMESWINGNLVALNDILSEIHEKEEKIKILGEDIRKLKWNRWECVKKLKKVGIKYE